MVIERDNRRQSIVMEKENRRQSLAPDNNKRQSLAPDNNKRHSLASEARLRKHSTADGILSRKNSVAVNPDDSRHRAISLKEKLEAMVAEHATKDRSSTSNTHRSNSSNQGEIAAASPIQTQVPKPIELLDESKYLQFLSPEDRARPQRIKDTLMMWDKEMVEALSPDTAKSPQTAIKFYGHTLSKYEHAEIVNYSEIYFVGHQSKKHPASLDRPQLNFGFDDEKGDYKTVMHDHLAYRYEILEELGQGSFGQVLKCFDHKTQSTVAIKLIRNKKRFYAQAKTEVKILGNLVDWVRKQRAMYATGCSTFVYIGS
jgi:hypothetical protein